MSALTHAVIGTGVALNFGSPAVGFLAAFLSHFVFDVVPHNDYFYFFLKFSKKINTYLSPLSLLMLALTFTITLALYLISRDERLFFGALGGTLPDFITSISREIGISPTFFDRFHNFLHTKSSLATILLEKREGTKLKKATNPEEARQNYHTLAASKYGRLGWALELILELSLFSAFLTLSLRSL